MVNSSRIECIQLSKMIFTRVLLLLQGVRCELICYLHDYRETLLLYTYKTESEHWGSHSYAGCWPWNWPDNIGWRYQEWIPGVIANDERATELWMGAAISRFCQPIHQEDWQWKWALFCKDAVPLRIPLIHFEASGKERTVIQNSWFGTHVCYFEKAIA